MARITTRAQAISRGRKDGVDDVNTVLNEQGEDVVIGTLVPGHYEWDHGARNAGVAKIVGVPERFHENYYDAYAKAARTRAEGLASIAQKRHNRVVHSVTNGHGHVVARARTAEAAHRTTRRANMAGTRVAASEYAEAKRVIDIITNESKAASAAMQTFPKLANGMTPDEVKFSPEFRTAKARFDSAFARERSANAWFYKTFKKEILADRAARGR